MSGQRRWRRHSARAATLFITCLGFAACIASEPWDLAPDELADALARGDHAILRTVDFAAYPASHALRLGQDAPLFVAKSLIVLGRLQPAVALLDLQTRRGPEWARARANVVLAEQRIELGQYSRAATAARRARRSYPDSRLSERAALLETRAQYWLQTDEQVLANLDRFPELKTPAREVRGELLLMRAVSRHRLDETGWQNDLLQLARAEPASELHTRAWAYLTNSVAVGNAGQNLIDLMEAKSHLAGGNRRDALGIFERLLIDAPTLTTPTLMRETGDAHRRSKQSSRGVAFFSELVTSLRGLNAVAGREQLARVLRDAGDFAGAITLLEQLIAGETTAAEQDRYRWLLLDIYLNRAPQLAPGGKPLLLASISGWHDAVYFEDLLAEQVTALVAAGDWSMLADLHGLLQERGDARPSRARTSYLLARAHQAGLVSGADLPSPTELLAETMRLDGSGYYGLLAAERLAGDQMPRVTASGDTERSLEDSGARSDNESFVAGLFRYGLFDEGLAEISAAPEVLSEWVLRDAIRALERTGRLRHAIGVASLLLATSSEESPRRDFELAYPRYFADDIAALDLGGVPPSVFFALIREESRFDTEIVSSAGAVGLTQLMPGTAVDEARRMRLTGAVELTDPAQNLLIGSAHLARLFSRLDGDVTRSLMAYNAGLSRVRSWDRQFSHLPLDLYVEALPFAETRGYVRKILASAIRYGELYEGASVTDTVSLFFGEVRSASVQGGAQ